MKCISHNKQNLITESRYHLLKLGGLGAILLLQTIVSKFDYRLFLLPSGFSESTLEEWSVIHSILNEINYESNTNR